MAGLAESDVAVNSPRLQGRAEVPVLAELRDAIFPLISVGTNTKWPATYTTFAAKSPTDASIDKDKLEIAGQEVTLREAAEKPRERFEQSLRTFCRGRTPGGSGPLPFTTIPARGWTPFDR